MPNVTSGVCGKDTPPDVDASESAAKAIQQLYPQHIPLTVEDLSHNEQANQLFAQLIQEKLQIENIKTTLMKLSIKSRC